MAGDQVTLSVPCDVHAPGTVRAALADVHQLGWMLGDAMLVASELVTNAVQHSGCTEHDHLQVSVIAHGCIRIEVADPGRTGNRAGISHRDAGFGGLGLRVVEHLVSAWGSEARSDSYVVWAELPVVPTAETAGSGGSYDALR